MLFPDDPDFPIQDAREILGPIEPVFKKAVLDSAQTVIEIGRERPTVGKAYDYLGTRQHLMNAVVVEMIKELVTKGELPDAEITTRNLFAELGVGNIFIRFKQVDISGKTRNYPTRTNWAYKNQLPLNGDMEAETIRARLTLGWRWSIAATEIEDIVFSYGTCLPSMSGPELRFLAKNAHWTVHNANILSNFAPPKGRAPCKSSEKNSLKHGKQIPVMPRVTMFGGSILCCAILMRMLVA